MDLMIYHTYKMKNPSKSQWYRVWRASRWMNTVTYWGWEVTHPNSKATGAPAPWTLPDLTQGISASGCSSVSFITTFNKLENLSISLSSVSHYSKLIEPKEGVMGISD